MNTDARSDTVAWVLAWQVKLHRWTKTDKEKKHEDIHNLVCDLRTLEAAWTHIRANRGSKTAGVDGKTRVTVEAQGVEKFLIKIREELKSGTYRPQCVREKSIPKPGGKVRRLGIPTIRDRIVQQAVRMVLEPIFEADFYRSSYAYRPGRRAQDAVQEIYQFARPSMKYDWVVEGDIRGCFDNVHHGILMEEVRKRIQDRKVLSLVRAFLKAGVLTESGEFRKTITGTPQGGILSPLLANIYLSRLDRFFQDQWDKLGGTSSRRRTSHRKGRTIAYMVRFADDFVVMLRGTKDQAEALKRETASFLQDHLKMELSLEKTHVTRMSEGFDFLGFHIVRKPDKNGKDGVRIYPCKKSLMSVQRKVKALTSLDRTRYRTVAVLAPVNAALRGWAYYFRFAHSKRTFSYLGHFSWIRVCRWMRKKHPKLGGKVLKRRFFPDGVFRAENLTLFNPAEVKVERYGYRGVQIPTPWDQGTEQPRWKRRGDRLPEEAGFLENLELTCHT